jgi:2-keto-4-pentenoate hydratase/2-oxohepta-3-ene-1,7-dioic acid hydratase in catechol pathway
MAVLAPPGNPVGRSPVKNMRLYQTNEGIARADNGELAVLDVPHPDICALLSDTDVDAMHAPIRARFSKTDAVLLAPNSPAAKLILVGANYLSHIEEAGLQTPTRAMGLPVPATAISAPFAPIILPVEAPTMVDYEGEIAVLIGNAGRDIPAGSGWSHIAGLCVANDISARDVQLAGMQNGQVTDIEKIIKGKTFPSFKPLGPCVVTVVDIKDRPLTLTTRVNGSQRQHADTSEMLFDFGQVVEQISAAIELKSGDIILTGTPSGVGLADNRYLQAGDVVEVEVDVIGTLRNTVCC